MTYIPGTYRLLRCQTAGSKHKWKLEDLHLSAARAHRPATVASLCVMQPYNYSTSTVVIIK